MKNKWLWILAGTVMIVIIAIVIRPNASKKLLDLFKKDLTQKEQVSKEKYDALEKQRKTDSIKYIEAINSKSLEIGGIKKQLELQKLKTKTYEKELASYRRGNFDERFRKFSNLVIKDSLE